MFQRFAAVTAAVGLAATSMLAFSSPAAADTSGAIWSISTPSVPQEPLAARPGSWVSFAATVAETNGQGTGALTIDVPPGLGTGVKVFEYDEFQADPKLGAQLVCSASSASQAVCAVPEATGSDFGLGLEIFVPTNASGTPGQTADIGLEIAPAVGQSPDPSASTATVHVRYAGSSKLVYTFTPEQVSIPVGSSTTIDLTVTNNGPATSPVLRTDVPSDPPSDGANAPFTPEARGPDVAAHSPIGWQVQPLASGASATLHITVTANIANATGHLNAIDETFTPTPDCFDAGCGLLASATLTSTPAKSSSDAPHVRWIITDDGTALGANPRLARGESIEVALGGFGAGAAVHVALHSAPRDLGTVTAGPDGSLSYRFTVPRQLSSGAHALVFTAGATSLRVPFALGGPATSIPASTSQLGTSSSGSGAQPPLAATGAPVGRALVFGVLMLVLGFGVLLIGRANGRRDQAGSTEA